MDAVELAPGVFVSAEALRFAFSRSSGPGGQNVNKRSTKAELRVALADLPLAPRVAERLVAQAGSLVTSDREVLITSDEHRSQARNRAACLERLRALVASARIEPKRRHATRPSKGAVERRLVAKKARSAVKQARKKEVD